MSTVLFLFNRLIDTLLTVKMSTERANNSSFWKGNEEKVKEIEKEWYRKHVSDKDDHQIFSMGGVLDGQLEKVVGSHLLLSGPLVDSYLNEIGKSFLEKLRRSNLTGLVPPITMFLPDKIFDNLASLIVGYKGDKEIKVSSKKRKTVIFLDDNESAQKLFHPSRFDGTFFLSKRKFKKVVDEKSLKVSEVYDGCARVVISLYTPVKFDYNHKSQKITISIFVQRYDSDDIPIDKALQALMNQDDI